MKNIFTVAAALLATLFAASCHPHKDNIPETMPDSLNYTEWYSVGQDGEQKLYYFLNIQPSMSTLTTKDAPEGKILKQQPLEVTYNKPNVKMYFFDGGGRFAGYIIDKQHMMIDGRNVYVMQLFEVDEDGKVLLDEKGEPLSTMIFWKE